MRTEPRILLVLGTILLTIALAIPSSATVTKDDISVYVPGTVKEGKNITVDIVIQNITYPDLPIKIRVYDKNSEAIWLLTLDHTNLEKDLVNGGYKDYEGTASFYPGDNTTLFNYSVSVVVNGKVTLNKDYRTSIDTSNPPTTGEKIVKPIVYIMAGIVIFIAILFVIGYSTYRSHYHISSKTGGLEIDPGDTETDMIM